MQIELWQLIIGGIVTIATSSAFGGAVSFFVSRKKIREEVTAAQLKNLKDADDIQASIEDKAEKAVAKKLEQSQIIANLNIQLQVEERMRKEQGETLSKVNQEIGGLKNSELNCREQQQAQKDEMKYLRENVEEKLGMRHQEMMTALNELTTWLKKTVKNENPQL